MKELIFSVMGFHWLATLAVGALVVVDALRRPLRQAAGWTYPAQAVHALPSVYERQDQQSEPYSRAA
jgi:hypothetical protein